MMSALYAASAAVTSLAAASVASSQAVASQATANQAIARQAAAPVNDRTTAQETVTISDAAMQAYHASMSATGGDGDVS